MADRCVFLDDLLRRPGLVQASYEIVTAATGVLACVDARARIGADWLFARRWVRVEHGTRELYRLIDRVEARGFRFDVAKGPRAAKAAEVEDEPIRAGDLRAGMNAEDRALHAELFPEEDALLQRGYDWDHRHVYRGGTPLPVDAHGRVVETEGDVVYEWVRVDQEFTWRRYPLERVRPASVPSTRLAQT